MLYSSYRKLCSITLPYAARQSYMHSFDLANPVMQDGFEDYLEPVKQLCHCAKANNGVAHMTVDEKIVSAGMSQRRPDPHVDGCFYPNKMSWEHPEWGHGWLHYCNGIPYKRMAVIVASSIAGCKVYPGTFDGQPTESGDLSHIAEQLGKGTLLEADTGYLLSPDCVHESLRFKQPTQRTFLRIALPTDFWN